MELRRKKRESLKLALFAEQLIDVSVTRSDEFLYYEISLWALTQEMEERIVNKDARELIDLTREEWFPTKLT